MNITRRSILKALGLGSAIAVSGVSVAKADKRIVGGAEHWKTTKAWRESATYTVGDTIQAPDGILYEAIGSGSGN